MSEKLSLYRVVCRHTGYWADYLLGRLGVMTSPLPKAETQEPIAYHSPELHSAIMADTWRSCSVDRQAMYHVRLYSHPSPQPEAATIDAGSSENVVVPRKLFERATQYVRGSVMFSANDIEELCVDLRRFARDYKHSSEHAGEQGWVMVPREPTKEMLDAAQNCRLYNEEDGADWRNSDSTWRAMIAAAPQTEEGK